MTHLTLEVLMLGLPLAAAGFLLGLYLGERGRRRAAERWAVTGSPDDAAPAATSRVPAREAEDRFLEATEAARKDAVERGVVQLMEEARVAGMTVDEKQIRRDVETMMAGEDVLE
jgi:hypothetical protein